MTGVGADAGGGEDESGVEAFSNSCSIARNVTK